MHQLKTRGKTNLPGLLFVELGFRLAPLVPERVLDHADGRGGRLVVAEHDDLGLEVPLLPDRDAGPSLGVGMRSFY